MADYQGLVDWPKVNAAGYRFAITKATEGLGWTAERFRTNWDGIRDAGLRRGAYHYGRPDQSTAEEEARWFCSVLRQVQPDDILALDLEKGDGDLSSWALRWLQTVEQLTGLRPYFYSGLWFMQPHGLLSAELARYPLWLAAYQDDIPEAPAPWERIAIWQNDEHGRVPGIEYEVDTDVMLGGN